MSDKNQVSPLCVSLTKNHIQEKFQDIESLRISLNVAKAQLDTFVKEELRDWRRYTHQRIWDLSREITLKFSCQPRTVTRAWLKFWEIISVFSAKGLLEPFENQDDRLPYLFCNAELPGAGLLAIQEYMKQNLPDTKYGYYACSLLQKKDNCALRDSFHLYRDNLSHWLMNRNYDGDMLQEKNINHITTKLKKKYIVLYTHDAGMDFQDYTTQEEENFYLHLGCILQGLMVLTISGSFIAKFYTLFHPLTRQIISLVSSCFEKSFLYKPSTSGNTNSEVYFVGIGYRGKTKSIKIISTLRDIFKKRINLIENPEYQLDNISSLFLQDERNFQTRINHFIIKSTKTQIHALDKGVEYIKSDRLGENTLPDSVQFTKEWKKLVGLS